MLWRRPARAQPPIVAAVKWTLAAARRSAASASVIQSAAATIRRQSFVAAGAASTGFAAGVGFVAESLLDSELGSPAFASPSDPPPSVEVRDELDDDARRSFLAQPDPL